MLTTNQQSIALGKLRNAIPHHFKYTLKNTSSNSVRIVNISVGCGSCTQASTEKSVVEAGGSTQINVIFTPNSTGINSKSVTVQYEGGSIKLTFSAEVY